MIQFLIRKFIPNPEDVNDARVREAYGILSGVVGIVCNLFLFGVKLTVGLISRSIAVVSDALNNLTDLSSSLIVIVGAKLSSQPPDQEHPHGHGRYEYVGALVIALIIVVVGLRLMRSSIGKITHPEVVHAHPVTLILLGVSVLIKLWMFAYNRRIGMLIDSGVNRAAALDSLNDAAATGVVAAGLVAGRFVSVPLDGLLGLIISGMIIYTGLSTAKAAVSRLIGTQANPELVAKIKSVIEASSTVISTHGLELHDYGPGCVTGSIHAVVPADANVREVHEEIDRLERQILKDLGVNLVIHTDPEGAGES